MNNRSYSGAWPVAPTPFSENGAVDFEGMQRILDCMIDQTVDGICILANYSEQFLLTDEERATLTRLCMEHAAGRIPVIVAVSHFATSIAVERTRFAKELGAAAVMAMAPYHGALLKGTREQTYEQFARIGEVGIPVMVQDAPLSGVDLPAPLLAKMARELDNVRLFKIECAGAASKLRKLLELGGDSIEGPFDGEEGITLLADLDAGATGCMSSALIPELIRGVIVNYLAGRRDQAESEYNAILPIINFENRQCGFRAAKAAMQAGGVIESDFCRHPIPPLPAETKKRLLGMLSQVDAVALNWGK
ncbi:MAG: dihydrodipicolinate synthase family protein [Albidovulum sp.]|nr:dihydrodipicolinate synthase family protein [Albidovulum sp.]